MGGPLVYKFDCKYQNNAAFVNKNEILPKPKLTPFINCPVKPVNITMSDMLNAFLETKICDKKKIILDMGINKVQQ